MKHIQVNGMNMSDNMCKTIKDEFDVDILSCDKNIKNMPYLTYDDAGAHMYGFDVAQGDCFIRSASLITGYHYEDILHLLDDIILRYKRKHPKSKKYERDVFDDGVDDYQIKTCLNRIGRWKYVNLNYPVNSPRGFPRKCLIITKDHVMPVINGIIRDKCDLRTDDYIVTNIDNKKVMVNYNPVIIQYIAIPR